MRKAIPIPSSGRVLLVEDETRLREMLLRAMSEMGFEATGAASGEAALRALEKQTAAILIVDLNLPGMGGMELLEVVRQRWPLSQVIILTGFGDLDAAKQAIHLDVVDFLTKPCALGDLEIALERARQRFGKQAGRPTPMLEPDDDDTDDAEGREDAADRAPRQQQFAPRETSASVSLEDVEKQTILATLEKNAGNRTATANELGISLRKLYYRLAQYQKQGLLTPQDSQSSG
jgi:DNA-binding NtrC family response regulator